jgi:hypothetical protein
MSNKIELKLVKAELERCILCSGACNYRGGIMGKWGEDFCVCLACLEEHLNLGFFIAERAKQLHAQARWLDNIARHIRTPTAEELKAAKEAEPEAVGA